MEIDKGPENIKDIFSMKKAAIKPPAYQWQELALKIINELHIPNFKRNAVFKICKENSSHFVMQCFNDTKELCKTGMSWKYFFKLISLKNSPENEKL